MMMIEAGVKIAWERRPPARKYTRRARTVVHPSYSQEVRI